MKNVIFLLFLSSTLFVSAQECNPFSATHEHISGNLKHNVLNGENAFNELWYKTGIGPKGDIATRTYAPLVYSQNIWAGGKTRAGNYKMAVGHYNEQDWRPGTLDDFGLPFEDECDYWDQVFSFTKNDILEAKSILENGGPCESLPKAILNWPARGNTNVPNQSKFLADFYDHDLNGFYDPCRGDLPMVSLPSGSTNPHNIINSIPCQTSFYVMNDQNASNLIPNVDPIQIQIHVYSFTFSTPGMEDVIFWLYNIYNKSNEDIIDFYFTKWLDFDLGCQSNDLLGTVPEHNLVYSYNKDFVSEDCGANALNQKNLIMGHTILNGAIAPYIKTVINGIDTIIPPIPGSGVSDTTIILGSSSITIPVNCINDPVNCQLQTANNYYNLMQGNNPNGTSILDYQGNPTKYPYAGNPSDLSSDNMCIGGNLPQTTTTISTGPFLLMPGAVNRILTAGFIVDHDDTNCPDITPLIYKKRLIDDFLKTGFYNLSGPAAPNLNVDFENDKYILNISELPLDYIECVDDEDFINGIICPNGFYLFEGIKVYQVASENFDMTELNNPDLAYLLYQGDLNNSIDDISNWNPTFSGPDFMYEKVQMVEGSNSGIKQEIIFDFDYLNGEVLSSTATYFFVAVSYGYNDYQTFDTNTGEGQQYPYVESTCGIKVESGDITTSVMNSEVESPYLFTSGQQFFTIQKTKSPLMVSLLATNGKVLLNWNVRAGDGLRFNSSQYDMPSGVYFLSIYEENTGRNKAHKLLFIN